MAVENKTAAGTQVKNKPPQAKVSGDIPQPQPLKVLMVWQAPARLYKTRDKEFYSTLGAIAFLIAVILLFIKEWFAIVLVISIAFLAYVFATIKPEKIEYQLNNRGVTVAGNTYFFNELGRFWFEEKMNQKILLIERPAAFPYRLTIPLGQADPEKIKQLLAKYLPFEQPERTWLENAGEWLSKKVPLEKTEATS